MKVYLLKDSDFERLFDAICRNPEHGYHGGSSVVLSKQEKQAHHGAQRFFNYQVRCWADSVMKEE